jgi:hypothetical protein
VALLGNVFELKLSLVGRFICSWCEEPPISPIELLLGTGSRIGLIEIILLSFFSWLTEMLPWETAVFRSN